MPQGISLGARDPGLARGQSIKNFTKLPGLSESASLSHRYCTRRMSVHPQEINSLSAVGALSEFFRKMPIFNEY